VVAALLLASMAERRKILRVIRSEQPGNNQETRLSLFNRHKGWHIAKYSVLFHPRHRSPAGLPT